MRFEYELSHNESEETEGSEGFRFPYACKDIIKAEDFEELVDSMKNKFNHLSNGEWDWQCNQRGNRGEVRFHNRDDGMAVVFDVKGK